MHPYLLLTFGIAIGVGVALILLTLYFLYTHAMHDGAEKMGYIQENKNRENV